MHFDTPSFSCACLFLNLFSAFSTLFSKCFIVILICCKSDCNIVLYFEYDSLLGHFDLGRKNVFKEGKNIVIYYYFYI